MILASFLCYPLPSPVALADAGGPSSLPKAEGKPVDRRPSSPLEAVKNNRPTSRRASGSSFRKPIFPDYPIDTG